MVDTPVFQGHHVIEQQAFRNSPLLRALSRSDLFDLHGPRNMLNLPADQALAAKMGLSPHPGGPLGAYTDELATVLSDLQMSPDGQATLRGDQAAAQRIAARVNGLSDTLKAGLVNGDLVSNTPQGMTPEQANAQIRSFFDDLDGYQRTHPDQIAELSRMTGPEGPWAGVTKSEANVIAALDEIDQPGKSALSERWGGRQSLGEAIAEANQAGRLQLSEPVVARVNATFTELPPVLARAPAVPKLPGAPGEGGIVPGEGIAPEAPGPRGSTTGTRVAGAAAVALMAVDLVTTGHQVIQLHKAGNEAAAESAVTHFVGRNAGGVIGGFAIGYGYGLATGSWTGPGALATGLVGGLAGAYFGERWADAQDIKKVFTQPDSGDNAWIRDPEDPQGSWRRTEHTPTPEGGYRETNLVAAGRLVDELNYRAANDSYSLGLGSPPTPRDPFRLDATAETDPPRLPEESGRAYVRDVQTGEWQREVRRIIDGRAPVTHHEPVSPQRAAELEDQSRAIIAQNASNTPAAIAARYDIAFNQFGWKDFADREAVPLVIKNASPETMLASDGDSYTRDSGGEWSTPGTVYGTNPATGTIREELNRTWESQQAGLQNLATMAEVARAHPTPTQSDLRSQVAGVYSRAGMERSDAQIDAATTAITQDHERDGIAALKAPYFLQLQSDGSIATIVGHKGLPMEIKSTTTQAEIAEVERQRAGSPETPQSKQPDAPSSPTEPRRPSSQDSHASDRVATQIETAGPAIAPAATGATRASDSVTQDAQAPLLGPRALASSSFDSHSLEQTSPDRPAPAGPTPQDASMVEQIRLSVARLDEKANKSWDEGSERLVASAYKLAVGAGFKPGDNVEVSLGGPTGASMFVSRSGPGASSDPAANYAHMPTNEALAASPGQQYLAANQTRGDTQEHMQLQEHAQARDRGPDDPSKSGPRMS